MQLTKTHKIIISILAVAILLGVYIAFDRRSKTADDNTGKSGIVSTSTPTVTNIGNGVQVVTNPDGSSYTIEQVPLEEGKSVPKPIPDLNRPVTVSTSVKVAPEAYALASTRIKELQTRLKANPADLSAWIDLGIYQKQAGDYQGAILSWKYATRLAPNDYISLGNLGNLYGYFLKDNAQAEIYYKQAISKGPNVVYLYLQLAEAYRDIFKDNVKARAIIDQGLAKLPNDQALIAFKATLN